MSNRYALACVVIAVGVGCAKGDSKKTGSAAKANAPAGKTANKPASDNAGKTDGKPMLDQLRAAAKGKRAAVFYAGKDGVGLFIAGAGATSLSSDAADAAAYEPRLGLLWYVAGGTLKVLDLRASSPKPVAIVKGIPEGVKIAIHRGKGPKAMRTLIGSAMTNETLELRWATTSELAAKAEVEEEADKTLLAKMRKATLAGASWLGTQANRSADDRLHLRFKASKVAGLDTSCDNRDACYQAMDFGKSGWQLVVTEYSCGDACHSGCLLYDPKTKKVAQPKSSPTPTWVAPSEIEGSGACADYRFAAGGGSYFRAGDDKLCVFGHTCEPLPGKAVGMLEPGPAVSM